MRSGRPTRRMRKRWQMHMKHYATPEEIAAQKAVDVTVRFVGSVTETFASINRQLQIDGEKVRAAMNGIIDQLYKVNFPKLPAE
jgi:hypothetical protein